MLSITGVNIINHNDNGHKDDSNYDIEHNKKNIYISNNNEMNNNDEGNVKNVDNGNTISFHHHY